VNRTWYEQRGAAGVKQSNSNQEWFGPLFRLTGYCLLALSLVDLFGIFIPLGFTNPVWEFQLANQLVERAPVPLLGLVLVLIGEQSFKIFKYLSWSSLVAGVLFVLLVPLSISSGWRIELQNEWQLSQKTAQIQQLKQQLNAANTPAEISEVLSRLNPQNVPLEIKNPQEIKRQVLGKIAQAEQVAQVQSANQANNSLVLLKNTVKLVLGSLISGTAFLIIWDKTRKIIKASQPRE
jgi:hypothetical protein